MKIVEIKDSNIKTLSRIKRKKVQFDSGETISVPLKIFTFHKLKRGKKLNENEYQRLIEDIFQYEWHFTMKWLAKKERSEKELKDKLQQRDVSSEVIEKILKKTREYNFINNERTKAILIKQLYEKGYGPVYIKTKLKEKGLSYGEDDFSPYDFVKSCKKVFKKNIQRYANKKNKDILILNYLTRRGFTYEIIKEILKGVINE